MILRQIDKGNARPIGELRLILKIDDLTSGADRTTVHDHCKIISLAGEQEISRLNLHAPTAKV